MMTATTSSLDSSFIPPSPDAVRLGARLAKRIHNPAEVLESLRGCDFTTVCDSLRILARDAAARGEAQQAIATLGDLQLHISSLPDADTGALLDFRALIMQLITALYIGSGILDTAAASSAASTLSLLALMPRRKDPVFLEILGSLLFDISVLHSASGEYKQAERELEKAVKVFERLSKTNPDRFATAVVTALGSATSVYHNRVKQAELLAHYQAAAAAYTRMVSDGMAEATGRLAEALVNEGDTLARMGRHREAVQYYTRALRYLQRVEPEFNSRQLQISVSMAASMLHMGNAMKEKAVHLLNTMLHKAARIDPAQLGRIEYLLGQARTGSNAILSLWHKIFPR